LARKTQERREKVRDVLVEIAERRIAASGHRKLTARDLAAEAGCAVGAIYTIFRDMDALVAAVNSRTAARLEEAVRTRFAAEPEALDARRRLVLLGRLYLDFVVSNRFLWAAVFDTGIAADPRIAADRMAEQARLIGHIAQPLRDLLPNLPDRRIVLVARALFSAVHGIVSLGLQRQFVGTGPEEVAEQITFIVDAFCAGAAQGTSR
jgi:AcrR family transcriptional regulator